jgi:hypothetical protein
MVVGNGHWDRIISGINFFGKTGETGNLLVSHKNNPLKNLVDSHEKHD